jgi:hypothetical protein
MEAGEANRFFDSPSPYLDPPGHYSVACKNVINGDVQSPFEV